MEKNYIENILKDLYQIDPELKSYEKDLIKTINEMINLKPNTNFDEKFAKELKTKLMKKAEELKKEKKEIKSFFQLPNFIFVPASLTVVMVLIAVTFFYFNYNKPGENNNQKIAFERLEDKAFGSLSMAGGPEEGSAKMGLGAGGGALSAGSDAMIQGEKIGILPFVSYKYVYKGGEFTIDEEKVEVFRKNKIQNNFSASSILNNLSIDLLDLSQFSNAKLQYATIYEDNDFGYMVNISPEYGNISINQYYEKWQDEKTLQCQGLADAREVSDCYYREPLKISDIPADETLIAMADDFIKKFQIDLSSYGGGEINNQWRENYDKTENKSEFYIPEAISVVYPLLINGKKVYNYGGEAEGVVVNIDIRQNKVSGAWNIMHQSYQASYYETEQDANKIISLAEYGGRGGYYHQESENTVEVSLGDPEMILTKIYNYQNGQSEELIVPALKFPIISIEDSSYFWQNSVVVPIIKDLVDNELNNRQSYPEPMPFIEPAIPEEVPSRDLPVSSESSVSVEILDNSLEQNQTE